MKSKIAYILINPYTLSKSRTGGVIGRLIRQTGLHLAAARMYGPSQELVDAYAAHLESDTGIEGDMNLLLADYVRRAYSPDSVTGKRRRVLMRVIEGEDAGERVRKAVGNIRQNTQSASTVRDIYGDYIEDKNGQMRYLEPAVLVGNSPRSVQEGLAIWASFAERDGGVLEEAADLDGEHIERTLVLIKPDSVRFPSTRPGHIMDIFSGSGLRIVGMQVMRMSVEQALEFYGPVQEFLRTKFAPMIGERAAELIERELKLPLSKEIRASLAELLGPIHGDKQFYEIIRFMTGRLVPETDKAEYAKPGQERCIALVYAGANAVSIIRDLLGPTDPSKAQPGSVRREFGTNVMVNAAHASDSPESFLRETGIIQPGKDAILPLYEMYYGPLPERS